MGSFHDRIDADECSRMLAAAIAGGFVGHDTTSVIVHDLARMRERIAMLHSAFPSGALHALAIKANPLVEVLRESVQAGMGLEAASIEEIHLAFAAGCPAELIVFDSPAKTHAEIRQALDLGVLLNANSLEELERIDAALQTRRSTSRVGLRVNPELGSGTIAHTSVAHQASKFGVSMTKMREPIFESFARWPWLRGLHVHVGSQGCPLEMLVGAVDQVNQLRKELEARTGRALDFVDIGGGLPAVYRSAQTATTPQVYAEQLRDVAGDLMDGTTNLVTEFGRAIQAGCGLTFSRVEYVRREPAMAIIHVGADHLMRPVYAAADWQHEYFVISAQGKPKQSASRPWTIAGPLCFSGDVIGRDVEMPDVEPGDWIVIRDTGAYTLSMWSRHCSRSIPAVLGYDGAHQRPMRLLRQAESPSSVTRFWSRGAGSNESDASPGSQCQNPIAPGITTAATQIATPISWYIPEST
jgi:diaminopimelate decarboxylase